MTQRSGRRRVVGTLSCVLCAGFVLGASSVDARPIVLLDQAALGEPVATVAPGAEALGEGLARHAPSLNEAAAAIDGAI